MKSRTLSLLTRDLGRVIFVAACYFLAGRIVLFVAPVHPGIATIWAPSGIALAVLLMFGYRILPGIFLGSFLVHFTINGNLLLSLIMATGSTLEGALGRYLIRKYTGGI